MAAQRRRELVQRRLGRGSCPPLQVKSGYLDYDPSNAVDSYATADAYVSFKPFKSLTVLFGIRNLTDEEPPFSNQEALFQSGGWDSRFYDPVGRTYYLRGASDFNL